MNEWFMCTISTVFFSRFKADPRADFDVFIRYISWFVVSAVLINKILFILKTLFYTRQWILYENVFWA